MSSTSQKLAAASTGVLILSLAPAALGNAGTQLPMSQYQIGSEVTSGAMVNNGTFESVAGTDPTGWTELTGELQAGTPIYGMAPPSTVGNFAAQPQNLGDFDTDPDNYDQRPILFDQTKTYVFSAYVWNFGLTGPAPHDATDFDPGDMAIAELLGLNTNGSINGSILQTLCLERVAADGGDGSNGYFIYSDAFPGTFFPNGAVLQVRGDQDTNGVKPEVYGQVDNVAITESDGFTLPSAHPRWSADSDGTWSDTTKWLGGNSPNTAGLRAVFGRAILADRTVTLDGNKTVGSIVFEDNNSYTIAGSATLTVDTLAGDGAIHALEGSHAINAPVHLKKNTTFNVKPTAAVLTLGSTLTSDAGVDVNKIGAGTLLVRGMRADVLTINEGKIKFAADGTAAGMAVVSSIVINNTESIDLTDNDLVVNGGGFTTVRAMRDTGQISSSTAVAGIILALFDNALVGRPDWNGVPISANAIIGKYTYFGDANIDGQVTGDDYTVIDANLNTTPAAGNAWLKGDMNLDGSVTGDDYTVVDARLGSGVGNPLSSASLSAVPEPATLAGILVLGAMALPRRRRQ
jgi:hypothetical protein